jgi:hypothetical protein
MRITGPNSTALARETQAPRRSSSGAFKLDEGGGTKPQNAVASLRTIGGIDALVALQGLEDATERRRRAVTKGRRALDALDEIKLGLIGGTLDVSVLNRLKALAEELKNPSGDPGLDGVLAEIELRVAVEIAKMTPRPLPSPSA